MIQLVRTAALLSAIGMAAPAFAQDGNAPPAGQGSAAATDAAGAGTGSAGALAPRAELMAQAQRLRMLDVAGVRVVKLDPAQAAQIAGSAPAGVQQPPAAAAPVDATAEGAGSGTAQQGGDASPEESAPPGEFLASFVEDTLNQIPVVQTALQANQVSAADVLRIDIHENNDVTIYAGGRL